MVERPDIALRRLPPDAVQLQTILGSLLGGAAIVGREGSRRLKIRHGVHRGVYIRWKYDRLGAFAGRAPYRESDGLVLETIAHPLLDDLARLSADGLRRRLTPLGFAVWLCDLGRLDLDGPSFLPAQRELALVG